MELQAGNELHFQSFGNVLIHNLYGTIIYAGWHMWNWIASESLQSNVEHLRLHFKFNNKGPIEKLSSVYCTAYKHDSFPLEFQVLEPLWSSAEFQSISCVLPGKTNHAASRVALVCPYFSMSFFWYIYEYLIRMTCVCIQMFILQLYMPLLSCIINTTKCLVIVLLLLQELLKL